MENIFIAILSFYTFLGTSDADAIEGIPGNCQEHFAKTNSRFRSQCSQDEFVSILLYDLVDKQDVGTYLEIGAAWPEAHSNTYFFEMDKGWRGVSLEIRSGFKKLWHSSERNNTLLIVDATKANYGKVLDDFPPSIDYLSLDIDRDYDIVLNRIPFSKHCFKVITIEHDFYRLGDFFRKIEREILSALGYYLLCPDVHCQGLLFEDWWIYPDAFPSDVLAVLQSLELASKDHRQLIKTLKDVAGQLKAAPSKQQDICHLNDRTGCDEATE